MTKRIEATSRMEEAYQAIFAALRPYSDELGGIGMLALFSQIVGKMIAVQDQTKYSRDQIMDMVGRNIEEGNQQVVSALMSPQGHA